MKHLFQRALGGSTQPAAPVDADAKALPPEPPEDESLALGFSTTRKQLLQRLASNRQATVLVYVNTLGGDTPDSTLRYAFEHLRSAGSRLHDRVALVVCTTRTAQQELELAHREIDHALRLTALLREHAREVEVLIPHDALGLGTLLAMGADRLLVHPLGTLGGLTGAAQLAEVRHLQHLLTEGGLTAPEHQAAALLQLAQGGGAARLGAARYLLSRLDAALRELLASRVQRRQEAQGEALIEALVQPAAPLAHPLDRRRAKELLALPVESMDPELEGILWELFTAYEYPMRLNGGPSHGQRIPRLVLETASLCHAYAPLPAVPQSSSKLKAGSAAKPREPWVRLVETATQ